MRWSEKDQRAVDCGSYEFFQESFVAEGCRVGGEGLDPADSRKATDYESKKQPYGKEKHIKEPVTVHAEILHEQIADVEADGRGQGGHQEAPDNFRFAFRALNTQTGFGYQDNGCEDKDCCEENEGQDEDDPMENQIGLVTEHDGNH